jgi:hypothetical protein
MVNPGRLSDAWGRACLEQVVPPLGGAEVLARAWWCGVALRRPWVGATNAGQLQNKRVLLRCFVGAASGRRYFFKGRFGGPLPGWSCCGQSRRPRPGPDHPRAGLGRREEAGGETDQARRCAAWQCARVAARQEPASRVAVTASGTEVSSLGGRQIAPSRCRWSLMRSCSTQAWPLVFSKSVRHAGAPTHRSVPWPGQRP